MKVHWKIRPESAVAMVNDTHPKVPLDYCDHLWREGVLDAVQAHQPLYFGEEVQQLGTAVKEVLLCAACAEPMIKAQDEWYKRAFLGRVARDLSIDAGRPLSNPVTIDDIRKIGEASGKRFLTWDELRIGVRNLPEK
ncbi:hypothetical protein HY224_01360 [Candidatus Uhrbacteria bacterium]|nr:hypothetical protein [Candidatus Uhrbacteria bacterium]